MMNWDEMGDKKTKTTKFSHLMSFYSFLKQEFLKGKLNIYSLLTCSPFTQQRLSLSLSAVIDCCSASAVISQHIKFC